MARDKLVELVRDADVDADVAADIWPADLRVYPKDITHVWMFAVAGSAAYFISFYLNQ